MAGYLPFLVAAGLAGCGSSGPGPAGDPTAAGVRAAGTQFVADLEAGRYTEACEAFTAKARASLDREPGGCAGILPRFYPLLSTELNRWYTRELPTEKVQGTTAVDFQGVVQARYEGGRWHLEGDVW